MSKTKAKLAKAGVEDLVLMSKITEDQIVENLKKRYFSDLIYTNIGPVLISVNPYKRLPITGQDFIDMYRGKFRHELPPHIYALAEEAYRAVKNDRENQCVIISGESGAGKTEAAKLIMHYISAVSGGGEAVDHVKHVILESNPLLEAFGNAKTLRNNNSSRFGKYFEIHFNSEGNPCGGTITNYLLEKSRVVYQTPGERSFHIFYDLLAGASEAERNEWQLYPPEQFHYLNQSGCYYVDDVDDAQEFATVRNAMNIIGFSEQEQHDILQLVAAILHLGNVSFQEAGQGAQVADENALQMAAYLLQVEPFTLQNALTFRVMQTGTAGGKQSTYNVPLNREQAEGTRDALAKAIYDRLFDYIVRRVNEALMLKRMPHVAHIGVLDIFGFEIFEKNGFEQFCINYVNEKLQQYFIELTLKAEQEEYVREGIKWEQINYFNNQVVVDLIEGKKPPGLFSLLDDVCATIHAQAGFEVDMKFLQKAYAMFSQHQHFRPLDTAFVIKHYAGDVTYEVEGFCDKNKDTLFPDLVEAMQTSQLPFLVSLFPEEVSTKEQKKRPTTAGFKIRNSAQALMHALSQCTPHYIRCIKPNDNKAPNDYNESRVRHQVKYLGLLENVRVRRAGWAYRSEFARFLNKYKKLSRRTYGMWGEFQGNPAEGCKIILQDMNIEPSQWQLGKTKVFIRFPETLFHLEECLERRDYDCLTRIQQAWRAWKLRKKALEQRAAAADLLRGKKERQRASVGRKFLYDYGAYADNFALQEVIGQGEAMLFCDQVSRLNRRSKPERRDLVLTDQALYIVMRQRRNNIICYVVKSRVPLASLRAVSLSTLADNYFVLHTSGPDADLLLESEHKTELLVLLRERVPGLRIDFIDSIQYKISTGDTRTINFTKNESATRVQLKKSGKTLTVLIASGLPRDTDTTPKMIQTRGQYQVQPRPAQPKQQKQQQQQQQQQRPQPKPAAAPSAQKSAAAAAAGAGRAKPVAGQAAKPAAAKPAGAKGKAVAKPAAAAAAAGGGQRSLPTPGQANPKAAAGKPAAAPRPQPKPPAPSKPQARALYDYDAGGPDEISFREGDIIIIHTKDPGGWWEGELNGVRGWLPANYVQEL